MAIGRFADGALVAAAAFVAGSVLAPAGSSGQPTAIHEHPGAPGGSKSPAATGAYKDAGLQMNIDSMGPYLGDADFAGTNPLTSPTRGGGYRVPGTQDRLHGGMACQAPLIYPTRANCRESVRAGLPHDGHNIGRERCV